MEVVYKDRETDVKRQKTCLKERGIKKDELEEKKPFCTNRTTQTKTSTKLTTTKPSTSKQVLNM